MSFADAIIRTLQRRVGVTVGTFITVAVAVVTIFLGTWKRFGGFGAAASLILFSLAVYPRQLTASDGLPHHGLSTAEPEITNYGLIAFGLAIIGLANKKTQATLVAYVPLGIYILTSITLQWSGSPEQLAGVLQLFIVVCSWGAGSWLLSALDIHGTSGRLLSFLLLLLVGVQLTFAGLQFLGLIGGNIILNEDGGGFSRVSGTLNNPNNLGKVLVLTMVLLLPLTRSADRWTRHSSLYAVLLALIPIALTGGRAVFIGAVSILLVWAVMLPGTRSWGTKILLPAGVAVVGVFFAGFFITRFQEDPTGGSRNGLTDVALQQIAANPLQGIGPNSYVSVVGTFDPVTGSGLPVHNSFLLMTAEIGIVGATLLFGPMVLTLFRALRDIRRVDLAGDFARATISAAPAIILIAATGWGMTSGHVMAYWFFMFGVISFQLKRSGVEAPVSLSHVPCQQAPKSRKWAQPKPSRHRFAK